jgi:hypothetical protein
MRSAIGIRTQHKGHLMVFLLKAVRWFDRKYTCAVAKQELEHALLKQEQAARKRLEKNREEEKDNW